MALTGVDLSSDLVVDLEQVAPGVRGLRVMFVNVFAIADSEGWVLVDAGLHGWTDRIQQWAARQMGDAPPSAIVLTHGHFDHVGSLTELAARWNVPVYAHREELPYIRGERAYPPPDPSVGGGLMASISGLYPSSQDPFPGDLRALSDDGTVPFARSWRWLATPGHSRGHVSLFRESDRTLGVGDAFCTTKQESVFAVTLQTPALHGPPAYFTTDWEAARESTQLLASLAPRQIAPGHGPALAGEGAAQALAQLAAGFGTLAVPDQGRYVTAPVRG